MTEDKTRRRVPEQRQYTRHRLRGYEAWRLMAGPLDATDDWALLGAGYGGLFAAASLVSPHTYFMSVFLMPVFWVLMDLKFGSLD